jgi:hypothetical protein
MAGREGARLGKVRGGKGKGRRRTVEEEIHFAGLGAYAE